MSQQKVLNESSPRFTTSSETVNSSRDSGEVSGEWRGLSESEIETARMLVEGLHLSDGRLGSSLGAERHPQTLAERHPDWPHISINYDLGPHGTVEDFVHFPERLADADIYIVEGGGQDAILKAEILQKIADIDPKSQPSGFIDDYLRDNGLSGKQMEVVIRTLYGSRKLVGSFDLRGQDLALGKELIAEFSHVKPDYSLGDLEAVTDDFATKIRRTAELQRRREVIIVGQVESELERIVALARIRSELKERAELRVYAPMGMTHTTLYEDLVSSDLELDITTEIPSTDMFTYVEELRRYFMAGGEDPSRELKQRAYVEYVIIMQVMDKLHEADDFKLANTADINAYVRHVASQFKEIDIKFVFSTEREDPFTIQRMDRELKHQGLAEMPRNNEELRIAADEIRKRAESQR